jgi:anti-sigma factor RsiW
MICSDFLDRYSDFRDDELLPAEAASFRDHLAECSSCRRYHRALSSGVAILRDSPAPELREDFRERVRFAIYQEEYEARRRGRTLLGQGMMVGIGVAATVAVFMALALLRHVDPVAQPAPVAAGVVGSSTDPRSTSLFTPSPAPSTSFEDLDFLAESNVLLYQNSPLFRRHREPEILMAELR